MDTLERELRMVKSDRNEMEERLKESQLIGSKFKAIKRGISIQNNGVTKRAKDVIHNCTSIKN